MTDRNPGSSPDRTIAPAPFETRDPSISNVGICIKPRLNTTGIVLVMLDTSLSLRQDNFTGHMAPLVACRSIHDHHARTHGFHSLSLPSLVPVSMAETDQMRARKRLRSLTPRKRVQFQDEVSSIVVPRSTSENWIEEKTFLKFLVLSKRKSIVYAKARPEYSQAIKNLGFEEGMEAQNSIALLAKSESRGLEQFLVSDLKQNRKRAVHHVLLMQDKLRSDNLVNSDTMSYLLRGKSKQLSQCRRHRALQLAKADRLSTQLCTNNINSQR